MYKIASHSNKVHNILPNMPLYAFNKIQSGEENGITIFLFSVYRDQIASDLFKMYFYLLTCKKKIAKVTLSLWQKVIKEQ